ncbi:MAG: hypothetical protein FWH57_13740 [Oscillospiraceae bacterium]|nr:hypothetical protein [Oscillospiraceae bacterium]
MESKSSKERTIITLVGRTATIVEEYFVCPRCKDGKTGRRVIHHSEILRGILPLNSKYGYDMEVEAGHLQYADNKQMDEMRSIFENSYGLSVSQSQIHELGIRFLQHMVAHHYLSAPLLKKLFESGCIYHIDATCEAGRGMEFSVKEGWTGIVLGVWKIPTENEEIIKKYLRSIVELFGEPIAFVSDLGNGMMAAIASVIREMRLRSFQLICHMHFLKAVGKCTLEDIFKTLKSQFKNQKTLAHLNRFVKETGDIIKPQAAAMRDFVVQWQKSGAQLHVSGYLESVAILRAFAQWVIMFHKDCGGEGFPFVLPHVKLFDRCAATLSSLLNLSGKNCFHGQALKYAQRLRQILLSVVENPEIQKTVRDLKAADAVFMELREVLRLEKTDVYKQEKDKKSPDELKVVAKLKEETSRFYRDLSKRLETGIVTGVQADAACIILDYLDQYEFYLFNHLIVTYDASGNIIIKLIERSNNLMERSYHDQKHQIRRRTGAKNLGHVFEHQFPAAAMMTNLENPIYRQIVLNNKTRSDLVALISPLDSIMDYRDTPMFQDDYEIVGGRLPTADKKVVGKPDFTQVMIILSNEYSKTKVVA